MDMQIRIRCPQKIRWRILQTSQIPSPQMLRPPLIMQTIQSLIQIDKIQVTDEKAVLRDPQTELHKEQLTDENAGIPEPNFEVPKEQVILNPIIDDPQAFSLGLTQEEKNREEARLREEEQKSRMDVGDSSKVPPPICKSLRPRAPASTSSDFVYPQKQQKKTDKSVKLSAFFFLDPPLNKFP
ncbi:uncharacterized protein LOC112084631 [Eutrema salsugineum]|uniref:uncharacterized protein LOC112084631 n=1 Tax=Eutrema salsugineum TaxID=72664 RepID=UPI000CED4039|nr:uncharacterized protein LOC112084631 [Eutrema salsugineum]